MNGQPQQHMHVSPPTTPSNDGRPIRANGVAGHLSDGRRRKQRVTITLPVDLLERLRNAVYWTGHGTLARLIAEALDDSVSQIEQSNGGAFPQRLAPLKRGRPRTLVLPSGSTVAEVK